MRELAALIYECDEFYRDPVILTMFACNLVLPPLVGQQEETVQFLSIFQKQALFDPSWCIEHYFLWKASGLGRKNSQQMLYFPKLRNVRDPILEFVFTFL